MWKYNRTIDYPCKPQNYNIDEIYFDGSYDYGCHQLMSYIICVYQRDYALIKTMEFNMTMQQQIEKFISDGNEIKYYPVSKKTKGLNWKARLRGAIVPSLPKEYAA